MLWGASIAFGAVLLCARYTDMAWLWWNVVGCVVGVTAALLAQAVLPGAEAVAETTSSSYRRSS